MKKLKIFYPDNSIKIHKSTKVLFILISLVLITYFSKKMFPQNIENLELLYFVMVVIFTVYCLIYVININLFRYETENGTYSGYLIIDTEKIICGENTYLINDIEKISILNYSIRGKFNGNISALNPKKSNGLKNYIEIICNNKINKYYFLQTKTENIKIFKSELKTYFEKGLIGEQNYKNLTS
jgi:uncharacterized membrane protein